jgi:DtxR family Mn-dependent transcriptional regulator
MANADPDGGRTFRTLQPPVELSESMEDYIEAIGELEKTLKVVRVKNIAKALKVKMPSVSSALGVLARKNLVKYEKYDYVELTGEGQRIALLLRRRHSVLKKFLTDVLAVEERDAEKDSCGMEHHVSKETINNLVKFIAYIGSAPLAGFRDYLKSEDELPRPQAPRRESAE